MQRTCKHCGKDFDDKNIESLYCSFECTYANDDAV